MHRLHRFVSAALAATVIAGGAAAAPLVASAQSACASNANLWHVHRRLDGAIDRLMHDEHDYAGHRVAAIGDLQAARAELVAAEHFAVDTDHQNPACFHAFGPTGGSDIPWGFRGQAGSDADLRHTARWIGDLARQLNRDNHDYGGHKAAAIGKIQAAEAEIRAALHVS